MKTTISKFVMTLAAALCLAAGLSAEPAQRVVVQVPFSFVAGSTRLPAGLYAVSHDDTRRLVNVTNLHTGSSIMMVPEANTAGGEGVKSSVKFVKVGNEYFMQVVSIEGALGFLMHTSR